MYLYNMDFGDWTSHLALEEMLSWGYELPDELLVELATYTPRPEDAMAFEDNVFGQLWSASVAYVQSSVTAGGETLPAHNYERHFQLVVDHGLLLFDTHFGTQTGIYGAVRQALALGLLFHDCHHCGSTLRRDHLFPLHLPELGTNISVEEVSAIAANRFLKKWGVPLPWRLFIVGLIWASTFGHAQALERSHREYGVYVPPAIHPHTFYHALMRVADCQPPASFEESLQYGSHVLVGEMPATGRQVTDPFEFADGQLGFLGYVGHCHDKLDRIAGFALTTAAGLRQIQQMHEHQMRQIVDGLNPEGFAFVSAMLRYYPHYS